MYRLLHSNSIGDNARRRPRNLDLLPAEPKKLEPTQSWDAIPLLKRSIAEILQNSGIVRPSHIQSIDQVVVAEYAFHFKSVL